MLHELSDLGTSINADGPVTPDLIDAVLESNAGVPLLDLGTRDNGHIAPVSPSEIDRFGLPNNTAAVAVWTLFDEFDGEQGSQTVVAALTADEQKHVLDNVTSVAIGAIVRHYEKGRNRIRPPGREAVRDPQAPVRSGGIRQRPLSQTPAPKPPNAGVPTGTPTTPTRVEAPTAPPTASTREPAGDPNRYRNTGEACPNGQRGEQRR